MRTAFAFCCCLLFVPTLSRAETPPDFSGDWVASDQAGDADAPGKPAGDAPARGGHGGHGGGMGGAGGHSMGGHGSHSNASSSSTASTGTAASLAIVPREHAQALIIRPSDDVFDIEANGRRMAYRFDGKHNYGPQYGGTVALSWAAPELVIETHPDGGGASVEEHYTLSPDGKKLTLLIRDQSVADGSVQESRRVYVRRDQDSATAKLP